MGYCTLYLTDVSTPIEIHAFTGEVSGGLVGGLAPQILDHGQYLALILLNCMKFGKFILRKINKTVATGCPILKLKCTKFDCGCGSAPDPAHSAPPDPLAGFQGGYF